MRIITRAEWGARSPRSRDTTSWSKRTEFVVHHSDGPTTQTPRSIQDFHMNGRGWADVGYNFLVDHLGRIYEGRGWLVIGAHALDHNTSGIGVCVIGRDGKDITAAAKTAVRWLYDEAQRHAGRALSKRGHGQLSGNSTACPGRTLLAWVKAGMPVDGTPPPAPRPAPAPGAPRWPGRLITQPPAMHGDDVRMWQLQMSKRGWRIAVDGAYGPASEKVCRAFQAEKHLVADGVIGPATWRATWASKVT